MQYRDNMLVYLFITFFLISSAYTNILSDTKRLYEDLTPAFETAYLRPVHNLSGIVEVEVDFYLVGIYSFDVSAQVLRCNVYWRITWMNLMFQWHPSHYGDIESLHIPLQNIWSPDLIIGNGRGDSKVLRTDSNSDYIEIFSNGMLNWWPGRDTETSCSFDITNYPFDIQTCQIVLEKWYLNDSKQSLESIGNTINTDMYEDNGEWELSGTNVTKSVLLFEGHSFTQLHYTIQLTRRWQRKCLSIILPVIILSFINCCCFCLPVSSGEKTGLAIAIFLTFIFLLSGLSNSIPPSSVTMSVFEVYINVQLTLSGLTVVLTVMIMSLYHTDNTFNAVWWKSLLSWKFCRSQPDQICINTSEINTKRKHYEISNMQINMGLSNKIRLEDRPRNCSYLHGTRGECDKEDTSDTMRSEAGYTCINNSRTTKISTQYKQSTGMVGHVHDQIDIIDDGNIWQETALNMDKTLFLIFICFNTVELIVLFTLLLYH